MQRGSWHSETATTETQLQAAENEHVSEPSVQKTGKNLRIWAEQSSGAPANSRGLSSCPSSWTSPLLSEKCFCTVPTPHVCTFYGTQPILIKPSNRQHPHCVLGSGNSGARERWRPETTLPGPCPCGAQRLAGDTDSRSSLQRDVGS